MSPISLKKEVPAPATPMVHYADIPEKSRNKFTKHKRHHSTNENSFVKLPDVKQHQTLPIEENFLPTDISMVQTTEDSIFDIVNLTKKMQKQLQQKEEKQQELSKEIKGHFSFSDQ